MVNFVAGLAALLSFIALVLTAIGLSTNHWIDVDSPRSTAALAARLNPVVTNAELDNLRVNYDVSHYGLWVGCHVERDFGGEVSCAYIGASCYSDVCWIRNREDKTCLDRRVRLLTNCAAYQATRALICIGTMVLIVGSSLLFVATCVLSRNLSLLGGLHTFVAGVCLMTAFAVFYAREYSGPGVDGFASLGWSFILVIAGWPIAIVASLLGCASSTAQGKGGSSAYGSASDY